MLFLCDLSTADCCNLGDEDIDLLTRIRCGCLKTLEAGRGSFVATERCSAGQWGACGRSSLQMAHFATGCKSPKSGVLSGNDRIIEFCVLIKCLPVL